MRVMLLASAFNSLSTMVANPTSARGWAASSHARAADEADAVALALIARGLPEADRGGVVIGDDRREPHRAPLPQPLLALAQQGRDLDLAGVDRRGSIL